MNKSLGLIIFVFLCSACGSKEVPNRLSCSIGDEYPSAWEKGQHIFDFRGEEMPLWVNTVTQRIFFGEMSRSGNAVNVRIKQVLHSSGQTERAQGQFSITLTGSSGNGRYQAQWVRESTSSNEKKIHDLRCLGDFQK